MKKKLYSIITPYFIWGTIKVIVVQVWSIISTKQLKYSFLECIKGMIFLRLGTISFDPLNGPLWYLIRIMSYFFISPILYYLIRDEFYGIIALFVLKVISSAYSYYTVGGWLFVFCFGGYIGLHYSDEIIKIANRVKGISIPYILIVYSIVIHFIYNTKLHLQINIKDSIFSIIIILCMIVFSKNPSYEMHHSNYAFLLYCSHVIWITFFVKIAHTLLGDNIDSGICQSIVLLSCCVFVAIIYLGLKKFLPNFYKISVGGRS